MDADSIQLRELTVKLRDLPSMVLVPPKEAIIEYLKGLESALGPSLENYGNVKSSDASEPQPMGVQGQEGSCPCVFTSQELANTYARQKGNYEAGEAVLTLTKGWATGIGEFLRKGYAGMVLDQGGSQSVTLDHRAMAQIYALLSIESFSGLKTLQALRANGNYHSQRSPDGSRRAFVYDSQEAGNLALSHLSGGQATLDLEEAGTYRYLQRTLESGIDGLVVNFGLNDERTYSRADLERMIELIGAAAQPSQTAESPSGGEESALRLRAKTSPAFPPTPALERSDEANLSCFFSWRQKLEQGTVQPWQFLEAFAFEIDVHVPVYGEPIEGLAWPQSQTDPKGEHSRMCATFTRIAKIREALEKVHPNYRRFVSLSGLEALRWIWSAPVHIASVAVDFAQPEALQFPLSWAAMVLFPTETEITDLKAIPPTPWLQLGKLPGARGLKPQVLRNLAFAWKQLLATKEPIAFPHGEKHYQVMFSGQEQFFEFMTRPGTPRVTVDPAGNEPPFPRWLAACAACDGMLLDPAGPAPLPLDHTDLLLIDRWARQPTGRPQAGEIMADAASLLASGTLSPQLAGRLAADFPHYWFGVRQETGGGFSVVTHNESYCLFSSEEKASNYIRKAQNLQEGGFQPRSATARWGGDTVFDHALKAFSQAWIDPDRPGSTAGLPLNRAALEAAIAHTEEHLKPRFPGFIWGEPGFRS